MNLLLLVVAAFVLDLLLGDPEKFPHPVKGIATAAYFFEKITRTICKNLYLAGFITVAATLATTVIAVVVLLLLGHTFGKSGLYITAVILMYTALASKDLLRHSKNVYLALTEDNKLELARERVGMIVGRDTNNMNEKQVVTATVESVAENLVDGITAPLFWMLMPTMFTDNQTTAIFLMVTGTMVYKTINTMDSLFGYKNDKYLRFGMVAAKIDDAANFLPARVTGCFIVITSFFCRLDGFGAARCFFKDRNKHTSPNAGHPEAAFAGALGMRFGGSALYHGIRVYKPYIGDEISPVTPATILKANRLALLSAVFFLLISLVILTCF